MNITDYKLDYSSKCHVYMGWEPITHKRHVGYLFTEVDKASILHNESEITFPVDRRHFIREYDYSRPEFSISKGVVYYPEFKDYLVEKFVDLNEVAISTLEE